jgi:localization factor PodJL
MGAGAPWSVKGIDPRAREVAKDLARRQGMTLGDWLNRIILEDSAQLLKAANEANGEPPAEELGRIGEALERLSARIESAEQSSAHAIAGVDQAVVSLLGRLEQTERAQAEVAARLDAAPGETAADAGEALGGQRPAEALRALESALGKVASHLYDSEARTKLALEELRAELAGRPAASAQGAQDGAVIRIVGRLEESEARTSGALMGLQASLAQFEQRLAATEARSATAAGPLEQLAEELSRRFEARGQALAEQISAVTEERLSAVEGAVGRMAGATRASEARVARIADKMGQEVLRLAEALGRRMEGVETRSAVAIQQVGGEVARVAEVMEERLRRADEVQAESLERLGTEIARITERLTERLASSERRTAQTMDDIGERVSRVADRLNERHERASAEITDRIRQSEERTARLLQDAREKIDRSLAGAPPRAVAEAASPSAVLARLEPEAEAPAAAVDFAALFADRAAGPEAAAAAEDYDPDEMFEGADLRAEEDFAPEGPAGDDLAAALEMPAPGPEAHEEPPLSTRELIERARAAARSQAGETPGPSGLFAGAPPVRRKPRREGARLRQGVMIAAGAALVSVSTVGLTLYRAQLVEAPRTGASDSGPAILPGRATPQAAMALAPQVIGAAAPLAGGEDLQGLYADAVRRIEAKDTTGVADLERAANLGYAPAQFYLAKLYEGGEAGVAKDLAEARRWTERAAKGGERKAMHNLALYEFEGTGGARDLEAAAEWFRKAADRGVVDSQYNLAKLYDAGYGVPKNPAEAYKWYLIAARSGDAEALAAAAKVKPELTPQAAAAIRIAARSFRPEEPQQQVASAG